MSARGVLPETMWKSCLFSKVKVEIEEDNTTAGQGVRVACSLVLASGTFRPEEF